MVYPLLKTSLLIVLFTSYRYAGVGESAVITLAFPYGARSLAMGEVGTALANDESTLFFNPAGLGVRNEAWKKGAVSYSFEHLLPEFRIHDLWHRSFSAYYQFPDEFGGVALYNNFLNMGRNTIFDAFGREQFETASYESVWAAGWGCTLPTAGQTTHAIGLTGKLIHSALARGLGPYGEGTATSFAVDAGYLGIFPSGIRVGAMLANMGPPVFYIDKKKADPLPFTLNAAVAYTYHHIVDNIKLIDFACELHLSKELVINHFDGDPDPFYKAFFVDLFNEPACYELQEINYNLGYEIGLYNTLFLRQGVLIDPVGGRYERHFGIGITILNHIRVDFSFINAPEGTMKNLNKTITGNKEGSTGARDKQQHLSITIDGLSGWNEQDREWWKVNEERSRW